MSSARSISTLLMLILFATGCTISESDSGDDLRGQVPTPSRNSLESFIGGPLPASATDVYSAEEGFQDTIMWLRFDAPPQDITIFLQGIGLDETLDTSSAPSNLTPHDAAWWEPTTATQGASGSYMTGISTSCSVFIDQSRPDLWRTYLVCFNT
jgi:hypothetical protein